MLLLLRLKVEGAAERGTVTIGRAPEPLHRESVCKDSGSLHGREKREAPAVRSDRRRCPNWLAPTRRR